MKIRQKIFDNTAWGTDLTSDDRAYVLGAYTYRHTKDHIPYHIRCDRVQRRRDPVKVVEDRLRGYEWPPVQFASDWEWLAHTEFYVRKNGRLDMRYASLAHTNPTWPDNPELRKDQ